MTTFCYHAELLRVDREVAEKAVELFRGKHPGAEVTPSKWWIGEDGMPIIPHWNSGVAQCPVCKAMPGDNDHEVGLCSECGWPLPDAPFEYARPGERIHIVNNGPYQARCKRCKTWLDWEDKYSPLRCIRGCF